MIVCSCTVRTTTDFEVLYAQHENLKKRPEFIAKLIWRDFNKDRNIQPINRCGTCIFLIVDLVKEKRAQAPAVNR